MNDDGLYVIAHLLGMYEHRDFPANVTGRGRAVGVCDIRKKNVTLNIYITARWVH